MVDLLNNETDITTIFEFSVGDNYYGINTKYIAEILEYKENTPVPNTPESIEGIFILREKVVVNLNMFKCLNVEFTEKIKQTKNVIIEFRRLNLGLIVTSVNGIHKVSSKDISEVEKKYNNEFAVGTIKQNNKVITLLDMEKVIHSINDSV